MTAFNEEKLSQLWNAIEYVRGTVGPGSHIDPGEGGWVQIHRARAESSVRFLQDAAGIVQELRDEVRK